MPSYRELLILDLARARTGFGEVGEDAVMLRSPACGDEVTLDVRVADGVVRSLAWRGHGCTVSMAAASALAALAPGSTVDGLRAARDAYTALVGGPVPSDDLEPETAAHPGLGDAVAFAGIGRLPLRGGCATLAWRALDSVLPAGAPTVVSAPPAARGRAASHEGDTMTFASWLKDQLEREDMIGDLARRVQGDDLFPEHGNRSIYEGYFESSDKDVQADFGRAYDETRPARRLSPPQGSAPRRRSPPARPSG
jgi:nitrogen fixation NifU-like protein